MERKGKTSPDKTRDPNTKAPFRTQKPTSDLMHDVTTCVGKLIWQSIGQAKSVFLHTYLVNKLQLVTPTGKAIGVNVTPAYGTWVKNHVSGHTHQQVPVIASVSKVTHCHAVVGTGH